jgi:hypothetical protein
MKRSKDYYQNRKMLKELQYDKIRFKPKIEDIETWFVILNEQLFGNKLEPFHKIAIKRHKDAHAYFNFWTGKDKDKPPELSMDKIFMNKKMFVEVLAHEMIHLFQHQFKEPLGHGPSFWVWRDNFSFKGLKLYKVA